MLENCVVRQEKQILIAKLVFVIRYEVMPRILEGDFILPELAASFTNFTKRRLYKLENIDKRNKLKEEVFSYRVSKDNKVFISWQGKQVMILKGKESDKFLLKVSKANKIEAQLIMAKITGNFKRGNEKTSKR